MSDQTPGTNPLCFDRGVDSGSRIEHSFTTCRVANLHKHGGPHSEARGETDDLDLFVTDQVDGRQLWTLDWQHTQGDEICAVNAFEALGDDRLNA